MLLPATTCYMPKTRYGLYDIEITQYLVWVVCTLQRYQPPAEGGLLEDRRVLWHQSNSSEDWCEYECEAKESCNGQRTVTNYMSIQQVLAVLHFQRTVRRYDKEQEASLRAWTQPGSTGDRIYQHWCRAKAQANRFWGPIVPKYGLPIDTSQEVQLSTADLAEVEERYRNERDEHKRFILRSFLPSEVQARYKDEPLVKFLPEHRTTN
jgi:hypothetical protein